MSRTTCPTPPPSRSSGRRPADARGRRRIPARRAPEDWTGRRAGRALRHGRDPAAGGGGAGEPQTAGRRASVHGGPSALARGRAPSRLEAIDDLDPGELAAISLAKELGAHLLLIDEAKGRAAAIALRIPTARTAAVLFDAASAGVLPDLKSAFDKLRATNFRVPGRVLDELLARHQAVKKLGP